MSCEHCELGKKGVQRQFQEFGCHAKGFNELNFIQNSNRLQPCKNLKFSWISRKSIDFYSYYCLTKTDLSLTLDVVFAAWVHVRFCESFSGFKELNKKGSPFVHFLPAPSQWPGEQ